MSTPETGRRLSQLRHDLDEVKDVDEVVASHCGDLREIRWALAEQGIKLDELAGSVSGTIKYEHLYRVEILDGDALAMEINWFPPDLQHDPPPSKPAEIGALSTPATRHDHPLAGFHCPSKATARSLRSCRL